MRKIWFFGDSFTDRYILSNNKSYIDFKGYTPKHFTEIISEKLKLPYNNLAESYGMDNYTIFETFCDCINYIDEEDYVVIGWSEPVRFRLVDESKNKWRTLLPNAYMRKTKGLPYVNGVDDEVVEKIFENRKNFHYINEVLSWINLINKAREDRIVHWTWFEKKDKETITNETNGLIEDLHYSEKGHLDLANEILKSFKNSPTKNPYNQNIL